MADQEKSKTVHHLTVFADNFQFQIQDQIEDEVEYPEDWNDNLLTQLFVAGERLIGIGTVRDLDVDLTIEIYHDPMSEEEMDKVINLDAYDHVVQCNIELESGKLMVTSSTTAYEDAAKFDLAPGQYGVRIFWSNLDSSDDLGFEGDDEYFIQLFPETELEECVMKKWKQIAFHLNSQLN